MSTEGLSLIGFLDEQAAIQQLKNACVPPDPTDAAVKAAWQTAQARLGAPVLNAGNPAIEEIPPAHAAHILQLTQLPYVAAALAADLAGATFKYVEINPLLAFQFAVDTDRGNHHCVGVDSPPTIEQMLPICLPLTITPDPLQISSLGQSMMVRCRNANFRVVRQGALQDPAGNIQGGGVLVGLALPFVHVVRLNGRCYLHNGYHRAVALKAAGATHVPCMFRDVPTAEAAGIRVDGATFSEALLTSADAPTIAHFARAHPVRLRAHARIIHVTWAEYLAYEE